MFFLLFSAVSAEPQAMRCDTRIPGAHFHKFISKFSINENGFVDNILTLSLRLNGKSR